MAYTTHCARCGGAFAVQQGDPGSCTCFTEKAWIAGNKAAWIRILHTALAEVDDVAVVTRTQLALERSETVAKLREICGDHGDNDWPDTLYLPDVLEKHLIPYLTNNEEECP